MQEAEAITQQRLAQWNRYHEAFASHEREGLWRRPIIPTECEHNAHIYYLLMPDLAKRTAFIGNMKTRGIGTVFHYVPLHGVPHAATCSRNGSELGRTENLSDRLVRLPLWPGLEDRLDEVIAAAIQVGLEVA